MQRGFKATLRGIVPRTIWMSISTAKRAVVRAALRHSALKHGWISSYFNAWELNAYGLNVTLAADYYSPLPDLRRLQQNRRRWSRPSELPGLKIDLDQMRGLWNCVAAQFLAEFESLPCYAELKRESYGEGYTPLDAMTLYFLLRHHRPRHYLEIGAGLSTYYAYRVARQNEVEGRPMEITCIEPFPYDKLRSLARINLIEKDVQAVDCSLFEALGAGDVLFIDSTHALKIDGDVSYLYLEILPRLNKGVIVHIHDVPFPYNTPFPPETWVFERDWPVFWTEAMLLQAFLCHNSEFQIRLSLPLIRFKDEEFLRQSVPGYDQRKGTGTDTYSSIWLERI
ncbi:MAG: methyltransferase family protein [Candidatus Acidoferrum typicum]|nr:methyltransferase family protein [Candidatus Acidoferrum typicum]